MEKLYRIDFNYQDSDNYDCFIVGQNCEDIKEIDRNWCRVMVNNNGTIEFHEVTNINHKYFRK